MPLDTPANSLDLLAIQEIHHETIILKNGGLVQVLMVGGTNFSLKPETEQNVLTASYQRFLNSLGFPIQIIVHSRKVNVERYLAGLEKLQNNEASPLLQSQISEYRQFVQSFVKENPIMTKSFFVAVPYYGAGVKIAKKMPVGGSKKKEGGFSPLDYLPFLKKKEEGTPGAPTSKPGESTQPMTPPGPEVPPNDLSKDEEASFEKSLLQMKQRVTHVIQGLDTMGLQAKLLNDEQLIELLYNFYNPETIEKQDLTLPSETTS
jgi:type IV secretory pathway VirB4 component